MIMAVLNPLKKVEDPKQRFATFYASPSVSGIRDRFYELVNDQGNADPSQEMSTIAAVPDSRIFAVNNYSVSNVVPGACFLYSKGGQVLVYRPVIDTDTWKVKGFKYDKMSCLALPDPELFDKDSSSPGLYLATDEGQSQGFTIMRIATAKEGLRFPSYENNGKWCAPCVDSDKATETLLDVHDPENYGLCTNFVNTQDEAFRLCEEAGIVAGLLKDLENVNPNIIQEMGYDKHPEKYAKRWMTQMFRLKDFTEENYYLVECAFRLLFDNFLRLYLNMHPSHRYGDTGGRFVCGSEQNAC
jgi:hypothetical protein